MLHVSEVPRGGGEGVKDREARLFIARFYRYLMEAVKESRDFEEFKARVSLMNLQLLSDRLKDIVEEVSHRAEEVEG